MKPSRAFIRKDGMAHREVRDHGNVVGYQWWCSICCGKKGNSGGVRTVDSLMDAYPAWDQHRDHDPEHARNVRVLAIIRSIGELNGTHDHPA